MTDTINSSVHLLDSATNVTDEHKKKVLMLSYIAYAYVMPVICTIGIMGNIMNLIALRSPSLQTVPFMYIRAIAVFDLLALPVVFVASLRLSNVTPACVSYFTALYRSHIELQLANTFLCASLLTALILTIERYRMICRPHQHASSHLRLNLSPRNAAKLYIGLAVCLSAAVYSPMVLEFYPLCTSEAACVNAARPPNGSLALSEAAGSAQSGDKTFCKKSINFDVKRSTIYLTYQLCREMLCRVFVVCILAVLNIIIVRALKKVEKRRRQLNMMGRRKSAAALVNSFTEKRLTSLMITITVIYVIGNAPQAAQMIVNDEENLKHNLGYQTFRAFANLMEIGNHCVNFYIFCVTSADYSENFVRHCRTMKHRFLMSVSCLVWPMTSLLRRLLSNSAETGTRRQSVETETTSSVHQLGVNVNAAVSSKSQVEYLHRADSTRRTYEAIECKTYSRAKAANEKEDLAFL